MKASWFGARPWLLRHLANVALEAMECRPLDPAVLVLDEPDYRAGPRKPLGDRVEEHLVLRGSEVHQHVYMDDPREPHTGKVHASLDAYFADGLVEAACQEHGGEVFMLPDVVKATIARRDDSLPPQARAGLLSAWADLVGEKQELQRAWYRRSMADFMARRSYRVGRWLLRA